MDVRQLARIDLNLLVALQVLLEERSVSKAAVRLFITQSAMSKTLLRLRQLFDDTLFTRTAAGLVPTPRALELQPQLILLLAEIQGMVTAAEFDPDSFNGQFTILMPDYLGLLLLPELMARLQQMAPHIRIQVISRAEHQLDKLADGDIDFVIQVEQRQYPPEFEMVLLGEATPVLVTRIGHPLEAMADYNRDDILKFPQVQIYHPDVEESFFFAGIPHGLEPIQSFEPTLEISHIFTAMQVIRRTDFVMVAPAMFVADERQDQSVSVMNYPMGEGVELRFALVWHQRINRSLPHQFVLQQILTIIRDYRRQNNAATPLEALGNNRAMEVIRRLDGYSS